LSSTDLNELHNLIDGLQRCVTSLQSRYGDVPAMRRMAGDAARILVDVERLDVDDGDGDGEIDVERGAAHRYGAGEKIAVPGTQHDIDFWRDVDDEGLGGHHGQR
jgi:hypothetical protein